MGFIVDALGMGVQYKSYEMQAKAAKTEGERALLAGEAEAKQLETRARQEVAVGSYNSDRIGKRAAQILASQRAAAAANGGDTTDATVQAITSETIREASMEQLMTMADAEDRARQDRYAAKVSRYTGASRNASARLEAKAARLAGTATVIKGLSESANSWATAYGS